MSLRVLRLGTPRHSGEGLRIGTVRHPPRGVKKEDYSKRDYFDVWLPELAPSAALVKYAFAEPFTPKRWASFSRRYRAEMKNPSAGHLLSLLAALSRRMNFSIGCYCEYEARCHRSLLKELLIEHGAKLRS